MTEDELDEDAAMLLCSAAADRFTRALDRHGWMIVSKPEIRAEHLANGSIDHRWCMNGPGPCPAWADPDVNGGRERKPNLRIVSNNDDPTPAS